MSGDPVPTPTSPSGKRAPIGWWITRLLLVVLPLAAWCMGQVWRDQTLLTNLCFYIPSPLMAAWLLAVATRDAFAGRRSAAAIGAAASLLPLVMVLLVENQWQRPPEAQALSAGTLPDSALSVVHWNVQYGKAGWNRVVEHLQSHEADVYCLSEVRSAGHDLSLFEGYEAVHLLGMAVVAKGQLSEPRQIRFWSSQSVWAIDWQSRSGPVRLLMVDVASFPTIQRDPQLKKIAADMATEQPDLVVGDFNSPRRSAQLTPPPPGYRHGYEAAGAGWSYTWPVPAPVFAIDQLMFGARLQPIRYQLESTSLSDHRLQQFDFEILSP